MSGDEPTDLFFVGAGLCTNPRTGDCEDARDEHRKCSVEGAWHCAIRKSAAGMKETCQAMRAVDISGQRVPEGRAASNCRLPSILAQSVHRLLSAACAGRDR